MSKNLTKDWESKLAELVVKEVAAENVVNARLTDIDGTGIATLVSKLTQDSKTYGGFALILQDKKKYKDFEWLQFITRQLVVDNVAKTGNLVIKANTTSYQLVESAAEITDYAFVSGSKPSNWDTCWKVDSTILPQDKQPFFREGYEYAISDAHNLTAILDAPAIMVGIKPIDKLKYLYEDLPDDLVEMKSALGTGEGISRAYFSDYLVKKVGGEWHIYARFDFSLTWKAGDKDRKNFTLRSLKTTKTTSLLDCHMKALKHRTRPPPPAAAASSKPAKESSEPAKESREPWKDFHDSIHP
ncbi:hypothetical protein ACHAQJ_009032 [Trichoderma viride]